MVLADFISSLGLIFHPSKQKCESKIGPSFYYYVLIPATLICIAFAFTGRRTKLWPSVLGGRPGILIPMDPLTRQSRLSYMCAFGATSNVVFQVVIGGKKLLEYDHQAPFVGSLVKMLSVVIYGVLFYPLFACLALRSVAGYAVGSVYVWMLTAVEIYQLTECPDLTAEARTVLVFGSLPQVLCLLYLSVSIPARVPRALREGRHFEGRPQDPDRSEDDIRSAYVGLHVASLFKRPEIDLHRSTSSGVLRSVQSFGVRTFHKCCYRWRHGFRYPTRFLSVLFVSMVVVYAVTIALFAVLIPIGVRLDEMEASTTISRDQYSRERLENIIATFKVMRTSIVISLVLAFSLSLANVLHMMSSFRKNLHALYKGDHTDIAHHSASNSPLLCVGFLKYGGFQVAYIVVGFVVQCTLIFVIILTVGFVLNQHPQLLLHYLQVLAPWLVLLILGIVGQRLLAMFVFLQDRGAHLALNNRRCFFVFTYFMFFMNMFIGIASVTLRILKSTLIGTLVLSRLDFSILPRKFDILDPGYRAYLGYIQMEYSHTHPVLLVFSRLLLLQGRQRQGLCHVGDRFLDIQTEVSATHQKGSCSKARRKWLVTYTLLRNPDLLYFRKVFNQSSKSRALAARGALEASMESAVLT